MPSEFDCNDEEGNEYQSVRDYFLLEDEFSGQENYLASKFCPSCNIEDEFVHLLYCDLFEYFVIKYSTDISTSIENQYPKSSAEIKKRLNPVSKHLIENGVIVFKNGNEYNGKLSGKMLNGEGLYRWTFGSQYAGQFLYNHIQGKGRIEWGDSQWYEGEFLNGFRHGRGTLLDRSHSIFYVGQWYLGQKHGKGFCRYRNHESFEGNWVMGKREGIGFGVYANKSRYIGNWKNGERHGFGTMVWLNGDVYRGEWCDGQMQGYGEYIWNGFLNDTLSWPRETMYTGQWNHGKRHGKGILKIASIGRSMYFGNWVDDKKHGFGMIRGNNGNLIQGNPLFHNDVLVPLKSGECQGCQYSNFGEIEETETEEEAKDEIQEEYAKIFIQKPDEIYEGKITPVMAPEQFPFLHEYVFRLTRKKKVNPCVLIYSPEYHICNYTNCPSPEMDIQNRNDKNGTNLKSIIAGDSKPLQSPRNLDLSRIQSKIETLEEEANAFIDNYHVKSDLCNNDSMNVLTKEEAFEEKWIRNCLQTHIKRIREIYNIYANVFSNSRNNNCNCNNSKSCNCDNNSNSNNNGKEEIEKMQFSNMCMSRLALLQFLMDCKVNEKEMSLVEFENIFAMNASTFMKSANPFEKVEIWQFIHVLLELSWHLYVKKKEKQWQMREKECNLEKGEMPGILASNLQKLLVNDIFPNAGHHVGTLTGINRDLLPISPLYQFYQTLGDPDPPSIQDFLRLCKSNTQKYQRSDFTADSVSKTTKCLLKGSNVVHVGGKISYTFKEKDPIFLHQALCNPTAFKSSETQNQRIDKLLAFQELTCENLFAIITDICPAVIRGNLIVNMDYKISFLEFCEILYATTKALLTLRKQKEQLDPSNDNVDIQSIPKLQVPESESDAGDTENESLKERKKSQEKISNVKKKKGEKISEKGKKAKKK